MNFETLPLTIKMVKIGLIGLNIRLNNGLDELIQTEIVIWRYALAGWRLKKQVITDQL